MNSELSHLKEFLSSDKRKADRLQLPVRLFYSFGDRLDLIPEKWIEPLEVTDIGGEGARFVCKENIKKGTSLILKINLPFDEKPIVLTCETVWSKKEYRQQHDQDVFAVGVKFNEMHHKDRKKFVMYLSDYILGLHIDDNGNLCI